MRGLWRTAEEFSGRLQLDHGFADSAMRAFSGTEGLVQAGRLVDAGRPRAAPLKLGSGASGFRRHHHGPPTVGIVSTSGHRAARLRCLRCLADDKGMALRDIFGTVGPTEADRPELERLVGVVERGMAAWADAGLAIKDIKDKQLWRLDGHKTWELWCEKRLGVSARRVLQLEQAAAFGRELADALSSRIGSGASAFRMPSTPAALEPLAGLATAEERVDAYIEASTDAGGEPTREHVKRAVAKRKGRAPLPRPRRYRVPGATVRIEFNRKGNGSAIDALTAALKLAEDELERIQAGEAA